MTADGYGCPDSPHLPVDCPGDACRHAADTPEDRIARDLERHPELRQRPEDQPLPVANDRPSAHDQLIAQLLARRELGLRRYGALLQPHNGRDTGRDLVEELLDGAVYAQTLATELADYRAAVDRVLEVLASLEHAGRTEVTIGTVRGALGPDVLDGRAG